MSVQEDRFWERVEERPESGCWLWCGTITKWGYGIITVATQHWMAHRLSWTLFRGPIPKGLYVCHRCDVRNCVRPDHLFLGTHLDNIKDMASKGRCSKHVGERQNKKTHCPQGHEYTEANTYRNKHGHRHCRKCHAIKQDAINRKGKLWNLRRANKRARIKAALLSQADSKERIAS